MSVTKTNSFVKNFSILSAGEIISHAISMLTNILLARLLSPESFGEYTLLLTYIFIFYTVSSLGLRQVIIRLIARNQSNSKYLFYYSVFLRIIGFVFSILVFFVYDLFYNPGLSNFLILALFAGVFVQTAWETLQNVAFGMQRMEWTSIINVVGNFFLLGLYLVLPKNYCSVIVVVVLYVFVFLLKDFAYLISLYKFVSHNRLQIRIIANDRFKRTTQSVRKLLYTTLSNFVQMKFKQIFVHRTHRLKFIFYAVNPCH